MITEILSNYSEGDRSSLIPILQDVQDKLGYLPEKELHTVSCFLDMPLSRIYGVATFYNQFRLKPLGRYVIRICRGTACHVKNSANILMALESELKIKAGETTRDKLFTLETVACIGACSIAPVISINDEYYGRLVVKDIPRIINSYRRQAKERNVEEAEGIEA